MVVVWQKLLARCLPVLVVPPAVLTVVALFEPLGWLPTLAAQLTLQCTLALILGLVLCLIARNKALACLCAACLTPNVMALSPELFPLTPARAAGSPVLRLLQLNVDCKNADYPGVEAYIKQEAPDVVCLEEVSLSWRQAMDSSLLDYPYRIALPREDGLSEGIWSKRPLMDKRLIELGGCGYPSICCRIDCGSRQITLLDARFLPPLKPSWWSLSMAQFRDLARLRGSLAAPLVVAGDLNSTPWTRPFQAMEKSLGLHDTRTGFGLQASWPSQYYPDLKLHLGPFRSLLSLPIDHCLVSKDLHVLDRRIGPFVGSDHYPVVVDLSF